MIMRNLLFILTMWSTVPANAFDRNVADSLAIVAREAYAVGEYQLALSIYDSINTSYTSAGLLHNIANSYFKLGDVPHAILYYERALKLSPTDEDVQANLELACKQIADHIREIPRFSLEEKLGEMLGGSDLNAWAQWSIWLCIISFIFFTAAVLLRNIIQRRVMFSFALVLSLITVISVIFAYKRYSDVRDRNEAIILAPRMDVKSEPRSSGTTLFILHQGTKITILQEVEEWYEVMLQNGNIGWIPGGVFERI